MSRTTRSSSHAVRWGAVEAGHATAIQQETALRTRSGLSASGTTKRSARKRRSVPSGRAAALGSQTPDELTLRKPLEAPEILVVPGVAGRWFLQVHEDYPKARVYRID